MRICTRIIAARHRTPRGVGLAAVLLAASASFSGPLHADDVTGPAESAADDAMGEPGEAPPLVPSVVPADPTIGSEATDGIAADAPDEGEPGHAMADDGAPSAGDGMDDADAGGDGGMGDGTAMGGDDAGGDDGLGGEGLGGEGGGDKLRFSGFVEGDLRWQVENYRGTSHGQGFEVELQQNIVDLRLDVFPSEALMAMVEARLWFYGVSNVPGQGDVRELKDLTRRDVLDPFTWQLDHAYLQVRGFIAESVDLTLGRTSVTWGAADTFNPTDNVSARDFRDPTDFTAKVPNELVRLDWWALDGEKLSIKVTGVWVPFFRPALVVPTAPVAIVNPSEAPPLRSRADVRLMLDLFEEQADTLDLQPVRTHMVLPRPKIQNSQVALRAAFELLDADTSFSFSYFYGRFGFPQPLAVDVALREEDARGKTPVDVETWLGYPRMHVAGFDISHSARWLFDAGLFGELAVIFPERYTFALHAPTVRPELFLSENIRSTPFVKATAGFDYTWVEWFYTNFQYVYGFFDEFNDVAGLRHHLVPAMEFRRPDGNLTLRLAAVYTASDQSAVLFPQLFWLPVDGLKLTLGGLVFLGDTKAQDPERFGSTPRFGMKAAGRSVVYLKARVGW